MRTKAPETKKIGKRIFTLKEIAQRDFGTNPKKFMSDNFAKFSLVNIQEDLLDKFVSPQNEVNKLEHNPEAKTQEEEKPELEHKGKQRESEEDEIPEQKQQSPEPPLQDPSTSNPENIGKIEEKKELVFTPISKFRSFSITI